MDNADFEVMAHAPGKSLLSGGYAVLNPQNRGYVVTMGAYSHVGVSPTGTQNEIRIEAPQFGISVSGHIDLNGNRIQIDVPEEMELVKTTVKITCRWLSSLGYDVGAHGMHIVTNNDPAFNYRVSDADGQRKVSKSGLGSSAAVSVATVGAIIGANIVSEEAGMYGIHGQLEVVHKLAQIAHAIVTGKVGSGFDVAAATYGSMEYKRFPSYILSDLDFPFSGSRIEKLVYREWGYVAHPLALPPILTTRTADFVGEAMITTKAVGSVSAFQKEDPQMYDKLTGSIDLSTRQTIQLLEHMNSLMARGLPISEALFLSLTDAIDYGRRAAKRLGELSGVPIEPDDCTDLIEELKGKGAVAAKLPGAGGKDNVMILLRTGDNASISDVEDFVASRRDLELKMNSVAGGAPKPLDVSNSGVFISRKRLVSVR